MSDEHSCLDRERVRVATVSERSSVRGWRGSVYLQLPHWLHRSQLARCSPVVDSIKTRNYNYRFSFI